jgi:rRNA small subunit aminocarboxypropyltransferase
MSPFPPTYIWRHRRENLKKCSLRGLEGRSDIRFFTYPALALPPLDGYILLHLDAPPLTESDRFSGILLLDATWRYSECMLRQLPALVTRSLTRSLPRQFRTAYPRRQEDCDDPERGLASIEALYLAYTLLGRDVKGLLDNYYWREVFLEKNKQFLDI